MKQFTHILFVVAGALLLMTYGFVNGFPLVYSDSGTYIGSGFGLDAPFDRPITYGMFLRLASLNGLSLWVAIFFQGLLISGLVQALCQILFEPKRAPYIALILLFFTSIFTGFSWVVSQLIADVFTPIALLTMLLLLLGNYSKPKQIGLYFLFFFSIATHLSHVLLFVVMIAVTWVVLWFFKDSTLKAKMKMPLIILLGLTLAAVATMGSAMSKSKHVFFMGAMVEHGILKAYLEENCAQKNYQICAYKDSLPQKGWQFVWNENSPLYKIGWRESKPEFEEIIRETFTTPKYMVLHVQASLKATAEQLQLFGIGDGNGVFTEGTGLYTIMQEYLPKQTTAFKQSKQNQNQLGFIAIMNQVYASIVLLSLLLLVYVGYTFYGRFEPRMRFVVILLLLGIFINAWDCGTFANSIDRLGLKMIWLLPFGTLLLVFKSQEKSNS